MDDRDWLTERFAGILATAEPLRDERRREPARLAHDGRGARSRSVRTADPLTSRAGGTDPEEEALLADSVGRALLVVLATLSPAERLAFVLHDMFAVPFDEIAPIVERSPAAAPGSSRAAHAAGYRVRRSPTRIWCASERSSTPSSPPRARVTSRRSSRSSTRTSWSEPTAQPLMREREGGPRREGRGRDVRGARPGRTTGARRRIHRCGLGSGWPAT